MQQSYKVLGVMSGTSLDGVDLAVCQFQFKNKKWEYTIDEAATTPYSTSWKERLQQGVYLNEKELKTLNDEYTVYLAKIIKQFITQHNIAQLDAICSHGHTILHQPKNGLTLQIGNLPKLAQHLKQTIVCDFRRQDVALGGQGAPLVPVGDKLLFSEYDYCMNLGGFANISYQRDGKRIAFDICPVNIVMNLYAEKLGKPYDKNGYYASQGTCDAEVLRQLNTLSFYTNPPPKSLGLEWVQTEFLPLLQSISSFPKDVLSTCVAHIAQQIALQLKPESKVLVTGGGAYNKFLLSEIRKQTKAHLEVPESKLVEYKEALIFGFLGVLRLRSEINCLASVTGASKNHSSGVIFRY